MKNLVVKFKQGYVGVAHNLGTEIETHKFEQNELGFAVGKQTTDTGIPNVFWALDEILKAVEQEAKANPQEIFQIAVPGTVYAVATNLDMMTKMLWSKKMLYKTTVDKNSHRTILLYRKSLEQRPLTQNEMLAYTRLFNHIRKLMGRILFVDSQFITSNPENAKTDDQKVWCALNNACNMTMGIGAASYAPTEFSSMAGELDDQDEFPFPDDVDADGNYYF